MTLLEVLGKVYGRKKNGELSHHAIKFCEKNGLNIDGDNNFRDLIIAFSKLSNKDKREMALGLLLDDTVVEKEERDTDLLSLRKLTYKESCRKFHPDNKDTGDNGIFQFLQEFKMYFWDCDGEPRKKVSYWSWDDEKIAKEKAKRGIII